MLGKRHIPKHPRLRDKTHRCLDDVVKRQTKIMLIYRFHQYKWNSVSPWIEKVTLQTREAYIVIAIQKDASKMFINRISPILKHLGLDKE